jgi:hypothetical protein
LDSFSFKDLQVGYIVYSSQVLPVFDLNTQFKDVEGLNNAIINGTRPPGMYTRTDLGIQMGLEMFQNATTDKDEAIPKILVVITDGQAVGPLDEVINSTILEGLDTFAVALNRNWVLSEVITMAQYNPQRVIQSEFTFGLKENVYRTAQALCSVHVRPSIGTVHRDRVILKETRHFAYSFNAGQHSFLSLNITQFNGNIATFISFDEAHPNSAIHYASYNGNVTLEREAIPDLARNFFVSVEGNAQDSLFQITLSLT